MRGAAAIGTDRHLRSRLRIDAHRRPHLWRSRAAAG